MTVRVAHACSVIAGRPQDGVNLAGIIGRGQGRAVPQSARRKTSAALIPPKPKELLKAYSTPVSRPRFGM
jgi:hypothetical protein